MRKIIYYSALVLSLIILLNACKKKDSDIVTPGTDSTQTDGGENNGNNDDSVHVAALKFPPKKMRAVWIATVYELDWPMSSHSEATQKARYISYLKEFKKLNINAIFFQVKPMADAFYDSPYEPWSKYITGTRGQDPGYDVLKFLIDEAHKRGIEFHAWMNPYRIATRSSPTASFPSLPSTIEHDMVLDLNKIQVYNPALPKVRQRLVDIVKDLITKYDVDGVHFDDYFYPAGETFNDQDDYDKYGSGYANIGDFRRGNVNKAIEAVHDVIVDTKPEVVFSVAPAPNEASNYNNLYADVVKWCKEGWLDIVIPQLYHEIGNPYNDYKTNLNYWAQYSYNTALMIGLAYYRFGSSSAPAPFQSSALLQQQFDLMNQKENVVGSVLYSAKYINMNNVGVTTKLKTIYKNPAIIPFLGRSVAPDPETPTSVNRDGNVITWNTTGDVKSVVYYFSSSDKTGEVLEITTEHSITFNTSGYYVITTINKDNKESEPSEVIEFL